MLSSPTALLKTIPSLSFLCNRYSNPLLIFVDHSWTCMSLLLGSSASHSAGEYSPPDVPYRCWVGRKDHLPRSAGNTSNAVRDLAFIASREYCCLLVSLMSARTPRFLAKLLFSHTACPGLFVFRSRIWCFLLLNCRRFLLAHFFSSLNAPLNGTTTNWCISYYSCFCIMQFCWECILSYLPGH